MTCPYLEHLLLHLQLTLHVLYVVSVAVLLPLLYLLLLLHVVVDLLQPLGAHLVQGGVGLPGVVEVGVPLPLDQVLLLRLLRTVSRSYISTDPS